MSRLSRIGHHALHLVWIKIFVVVFALISSNKSLWRDESFSVLMSRFSPGEIIAASAADFSPPLYYLILNHIIPILPSGDIWIRTPSLLFAISTGFVLIQIFKKLSLYAKVDWKWWLAPLFIFQVSLIYFAAELRNYSLSMLLAALMMWGLIWIYEGKRKGFLLFTTSAIALLYTHSIAPIIVGGVWISVLLVDWLNNKGRHLWSLIGTGLLTMLAFLPWIYISLNQISRVGESFWIDFNPLTSLLEFSGMFLVYEGMSRYPILQTGFIMISGLVFLLGGLALVKNIEKKREVNPGLLLLVVSGIATFLVLVAIYLVSLVIVPVLYFRYVGLITPMVILIIAWGLYQLNQSYPRIFLLSLIIYGGLSVGIITDMTQGLSQVKYSKIRQYQSVPIYTDEVLDITSCIYYHRTCFFVGDITQTPRYVGPAQLTGLSAIPDWQSVHDSSRIATLHRGNMRFESEVEGRGFKKASKQDIGDGVVITLWQRQL